MAETAQLGISVVMKGGREAAVDLDRLSAASQKAERATIGMSENAEKAAKKITNANDNVSKAAEKLTASYNAASKAAQRLSGAIVGSAIGTALAAAVGRLREMEQVNAQVNRALENAGTMAGHSAESIRRWADDLEKSTGRAASEVMAVSANLASFGFNEDVFFRAIKLADDMAAAWGGDLRQNLEGLSRALESPEKGLAMLSARGITFTKEGRQMAIELAKVGDNAGAAALLMEELESQVSGVAEAGFTGLTKASKEARRTMDQFFETIVTKSGIMTALETSLNGASAGMTFLAENADLVMLATGVLAARVSGPFVAAQVAAAASIVKNTYALGMQSTALGRSVAMMGVYDIATRKLNVSLTLATVSARAFSTALALVGGPAGAALLAIGGIFYVASQRAQEARDRSEKYAEIIRKAGENSATAGMGIREAAAALHEVETAATAAEAAVTRAMATADIAKSMSDMQVQIQGLGTSMGWASVEIQNALNAAKREFFAGEIAAEEFIKQVDEISRLNPDASSVIAEIQRIAREAAAAMGVLDALNSTISETITTPKTSRLGSPEPLSDDAFNSRFGQRYSKSWKELFPDFYKPEKKSSTEREAEKAAKAYKEIVDGATEFIRAQELEASVLGMTEQAANALRYEQDLLNEARRAGLKLADADRQGFKALAEAMAEAEERTRVLTERFDFMKDLTRGLFMDIKNDLISNMSQGMSFWDAAWKAMGKAALNVLDKIVDKLLNDVLDAIFKVNSNSGSGGGGILGFLGGLFKSGGGGGGALTNLPLGAGLYANGGVFDQSGVTAFAKGGIVERATVFPFAKGIGLMGEAGPEAIMPLRRGADGRLGVSMHGAANQNYANQNQPAPYVDNRVYNFTGTSEEFQQFKEFVVQRDAEFDQRAVGAVKGYYGAGNSI